MAGMRDRMIHEYQRIDFDILWKTVKDDIPLVKPMFQSVMKDLT